MGRLLALSGAPFLTEMQIMRVPTWEGGRDLGRNAAEPARLVKVGLGGVRWVDSDGTSTDHL